MIAGKIEDLLVDIKENKLKINSAVIDLMFECFDKIKLLCFEENEKVDAEKICEIVQEVWTSVKKGEQPVKIKDLFKNLNSVDGISEKTIIKKHTLPPTDSFDFESIRVKTGNLDKIINFSVELTSAKLKTLASVSELKTFKRALYEYSLQFRNYFSDIQNDEYFYKLTNKEKIIDNIKNGNKSASELDKILSEIIMEFDNSYNDIDRITSNLFEEVTKIRMLPVSQIFDMYPRIVRELAAEQGKQIHIEISGADTLLDKKIIEQISDPIMHIVRNSAVHGIETPEKRRKNGKQPAGLIKLNAYTEGNRVNIEISDDGCGLDINNIIDKAVSINLIKAEEKKNLQEDDILGLLFHGGLSTSGKTTNLSGRGFGLNIVKNNIDKIGGSIKILSKYMHEFKIILDLPLSVSALDVMLIKTGNCIFGIPVNYIKKISRIQVSGIQTIEGIESIIDSGEIYFLARLNEILDIPAEYGGKDKSENTMIILETGNKKNALLVDKIESIRNLIVKPLDKRLGKVKNISCCAVIESGEIVIILDINEISNNIHFSNRKDLPAEIKSMQNGLQKSSGKKILIVEDSLTTRVLEKNILTSAGYTVFEAVDGLDALRQLQNQTVDLIITDIQMPRMDGYSLIEKIKASAQLKSIPVIIVSARGSQEEKKRGLDAGADAFIVKTDFEQDTLIDFVRKFI